ncbi:MAG: hypothetical protein ACI8SE_001578 [Bacteroidia bacterium]|jgi:hypothetical protein
MKIQIKLTWGIALCTMVFTGCELNDNVSPSGNGNTNFTSANDYLKSKAPKIQQFTKLANQRFTLVSENGLHHRFKPNSFKTASGQIVNGQVDIKLTEYMTKAYMVFSGITTTSGSTVLESGAM